MKEEALEYQLAHCDGKDCTCAAYGECECACGADWTPAEVYLLRDKVDALRKDAERYRTARCMTPHQWSAAWELNVATGKPFDEIIDNMRPFVGGR